MFAFICTTFAEKHPTKNKSDREWTIAQSWDIPGKASGLAYDGTYLYFGIYGSDGDHIYKFDPSNGSSVLLFTNPTIGDCFGMSFDGSNLWITNQASSSSMPAMATEFDLSGNLISSFDLPDHYMSGIAFDAGEFWVGTYYPDPGTIYNLDNTGEIISQFTPPADQIWDICVQDDYLWMVDYNSSLLYKTDRTGTLLESHASENIKPSGIVFDGTYLWYVDGDLSSDSKIYKVNLSGAGTPVINIPQTSHNYGNVTVGSSEIWEMTVENNGTTDLTITNLIIPNSAPIFTDFTVPKTITAGESTIIPLTYSPTENGFLNTTITVESTDPISPSVDITLSGNAVNSGPSISVIFNSHNYYDVRMNAFTRWFLDIKNVGDETLVISEINSNNNNFIIDESVEFPLSISTLNTTSIGIWFNPTSADNYFGELSIENNDDLNNPFIIELEGNGIDEDYQIGDPLWSYSITTGYDQSPKAIISQKDITGDNIADVIISSEDNFLRCLNGNSSGIADVIWDVEISGGTAFDQPGLTNIKDIDGDTYDDIIIGTAWSDNSIIAFSGKTGSQIWKHDTHEYGDGGWVYDVDVSFDYNNDGVYDVLACAGDDGEDTGPKRVYCLNSLDGISIWEKYIGGPVFSVIGVEDFTGDGIADVIAGASSADETIGKIYGLNGANGNTEWSINTGGSSVWALLQLDDITGDGVKDIVAGDFGGNYYYLNPANGEQIYQGTISGTLILRFEKLEDVNGDGYSDILVAHSKSNGIVLNGFDGSNIWFKALSDKSWNVAPIDDLNGDNINDVIIGTLFSNNKCYFLNGVDGEEFKSLNYPSPVDAINSIQDIVGDGSMEMVAGGRNGEVNCYSGGLGSIVSINDKIENINSEFSSNFPNPFSDQTTIKFNLEENSFVTIVIYDLNGKIIETLSNELMSSGDHFVIWNGENSSGKNLQSGFYFYEIKTETGRFRKKIVKI